MGCTRAPDVAVDCSVLAPARAPRRSLCAQAHARSGRVRGGMPNARYGEPRRPRSAPCRVRAPLHAPDAARADRCSRDNFLMHDHNHDHPHTDDRRSLAIALALIVAFLVAEVVAALVAGSLALLADAGHMLTDAGALAFALFAATLAVRPAQGRWTFGYKRLEILAAQANGVTLLVVA